MKIIFAGTPDFAATSLVALIKSHHQIVCVLSQPDRPSGRGRRLQSGPVKRLALDNDIDVLQPLSLKNNDAQTLLSSFDADVMVVVAYGLILPAAILSIPKHGCLNIHASLLPRWRGAAPIHRAIEAGDKKSGICIMHMDEGLDTGAVISRKEMDIAPDDTSSSLHDKLAKLGADLIVQALDDLEKGIIHPLPQQQSGVTYAEKLNRVESIIDWSHSAKAIVNQIHAFNPWPGAKTHYGEVQLKLLKAKVHDKQKTLHNGQVLIEDRRIFVQAGDQQVEILELQKPGGKPISSQQFLNGFVFETDVNFT